MAQDARLSDLWAALVAELEKRLTEGDTVVLRSKEGDHLTQVPASAATLSVIVKFLKDNGVEAPKNNEHLAALQHLLSQADLPEPE